MNVELPDGTVLHDVPEGTTKAQIAEKLKANGRDVPKEWMEGPNRRSPKQMSTPILNPGGEAVANIASGMAAAPVSGFAGLAGAALPGPQGQGADWQRKTQEALTYEPRSEMGKTVAGAIAYPFTKLAEGAEKVGGAITDVTGSPALGTVANVALQAIPAAISKVARPLAKSGMTKSLAEISRESEKSATLEAGQNEGYVVMPESKLAKAATSIGGKDAVKHIAIEHNQEVTNKLARRAASLGENQEISIETLESARDKLADPYRQVAALPGLPAPRITSNLNPMRNPYPLIGKTPKTPAELVHDWKSTNNQATELWRDYQRNAKVETLDAYKAKLKEKEGIEDNIEKAAIQSGRPDLVPALREARVKIAKNYDVERALILGSGDVDPRVIASQYKKRHGKGMTDELETIAKFAGTYQTVMRASPKISPSGGTHGSAIETAALALRGDYALATGLPLLRGTSRRIALSKLGQPEPLTKPGLSLRLSDLATRNPELYPIVQSTGLRQE